MTPEQAADLLEAARRMMCELRRVRDTKPEAWDAIIDPGLCAAWDGMRIVDRIV